MTTNPKSLASTISNCLESNPIEVQTLCQFFDKDNDFFVDEYLKQETYSLPILLYILEKSPVSIQNRIRDFLLHEKHILPFLENEDLFKSLENWLPEEEVIKYVKCSGLIFDKKWEKKWSKFFKDSQNEKFKHFHRELLFLKELSTKAEKQAKEEQWLQNIDWQTFLMFLVYHFAQESKNHPISPINLQIAEFVFFMVEHKKNGNQDINETQFKKILTEDNIELNRLFIPVNLYMEKIGYEKFNEALNKYTEFLHSKKLLEDYCYLDNIGIEFNTDKICRIYVKSIQNQIDIQKDILKYSYSTRFYNDNKNSLIENHHSVKTIKKYFSDYCFEIYKPIKLKNGKTIIIELLAEISNLLIRIEWGKHFALINKNSLINILFSQLSARFNKTDIEDNMDFLITKFPCNKPSETFRLPIYQIDNFIFWIPTLLFQTGFLTGLLNKIWNEIIDNETKNVTTKQENLLKKLLEHHGFIAFANDKFENTPNGNDFEFDTIALKDGTLYLFELKTTYFRYSSKGVYEHLKKGIFKSAQQMRKRRNFVVENIELFKQEFDGKEIKEIVCYSVSTAFDYDKYSFIVPEGKLATKISFFELLIILRNERHKLFDKNLILEKILRLRNNDSMFQQLLGDKHPDYSELEKEWLLYERGTKLGGEDLCYLIENNTCWEWMNDNWDLFTGEYISPDKEGKIFYDSNNSEIKAVIHKYKWWEEFFREDAKNSHKVLYIIPYKQDALACVNAFLEIFPSYTEALFIRGKILFAIEDYNDAISTFEKILDIDFAEGIGLNPWENRPLDWLIECYRKTNQADKARELAKKCLKFHRFYLSILILAELELEFGSKEEAQKLARAYMERIPASDYLSRLQASQIVSIKFGVNFE